MKVRRLVMTLTVVAMVMGAMAPAWAGSGGVNATDLQAKGWFCFDNSGDGGAGVHCTKGLESMAELQAYISGNGGTGNLHFMVFSPGDGAIFYGTELLGFDKDGVLFAEHHWKAGVPRP